MKRRTVKKAAAAAMALVFMITASAVPSFALRSYTGSAVHKSSVDGDSVSGFASTFTDSNGKTQTAELSSVCFSFTGNITETAYDYSRAASFAEDMGQKYPRFFMTDTGGFSQINAYKLINSSGAGLRTLGAAGYDFAFPNAEDLAGGESRLASTINGAASSGDTVPYLGAVNVKTSNKLENAYSSYGVNDYIKIDKYNADVAIFKVIGKDALESKTDKVKYQNAVSRAEEIVNTINNNETADFIICICESGTGDADKDKKLEKKIASSVDGIDLIVSTGSSTAITKAITRNGTKIVSLPDDGESVLSVVYENTASGTSHDSFSYSSCNIKKITNYKRQSTAASQIRKYCSLLNSSYFNDYGYKYNTEAAAAYFTIHSVDYDLKQHKDSPTGELIADAYRYSAIHDGKISSKRLITAASSYSLEGAIKKGSVTALDLYSVMSSGKSADGTSGQALVEFYLSGSEVEAIAEKAAVTAGIKGKTQLCFGGLTYKYNPKRGENYELYDVAMSSKGAESGMGSKIKDDKLYRIITDEKTADYICSITYKNDADGTTEKIIPKDRQGADKTSFTEVPAVTTMRSIKCWQAMASYFSSFDKTTGVPATYRKADDRYTYSSDGSLTTLLEGQTGSVVVFIIVLLIGVLTLITLIWLIRGTIEYNRDRKKREKSENR